MTVLCMKLKICSGDRLLAADAAGTHPVTCRTRKLSLRALMVLCGVRTGEQTAASLDKKQKRGSSLLGFLSFLCLFYVYTIYLFKTGMLLRTADIENEITNTITEITGIEIIGLKVRELRPSLNRSMITAT